MKRVMTMMAVLCVAMTAAHAGSVQCGMLIYGGTQTSRCFSDEFLNTAQKETTIVTERRFKTVKLASHELFQFPFVIMTGENDFTLTPQECDNLKRYLENGGFLLASAGCSSKNFDQAFIREMRKVFPDRPLTDLPRTSPIFRTVYTIERLDLKSPVTPEPTLKSLDVGGKTVIVYSSHGLNNTANIDGCCCCGGNEVKNSLQVNVNILAYALLY